MFDPVRIGLAIIIFSASFTLFTGNVGDSGLMMPTAKEASQWFGIVIMLFIGPFAESRRSFPSLIVYLR